MGIKRVLIAGSRSFTDYEQAKMVMDFYLSNVRKEHEIVIVSGGAKGADILGERYAVENGFKVEKYLPNWETYGRSAGIRRNKTMVEVSDYVVCFWDGISRGTNATIGFARKMGKPLQVRII
ncbi:MAG: DUF2493 domain-containing protein [Clostridia bacterium]|nr:DUF2493 domain-containing protein [Clostridia bacterium]